MAPVSSSAVCASLARNQYRTYRSSNPRRGDYETIVDIPNQENTRENRHFLVSKDNSGCPSGFWEALFFISMIATIFILIALIQKYYLAEDLPAEVLWTDSSTFVPDSSTIVPNLYQV